jgi:predicted nucleotidyltransferase
MPGSQGAMTSSAATTIRQRLDALKPQVLAVATRHGASNLRIYGSIATGDEHSASDLDLLVDLPEEQSLLGLISLRQDLEDLLGCSVDVTEAESLHPLIRAEILDQALAL